MSKKQYDEKQIIERGKSFQYAFTCAIVVNIIIYLLSDFIGIGFANGAIFLINIGLPIATYMLSMIIKNGYDGVSNDGEKLNISALGGSGVGLLIVYLPDIISGKKPLIDNAKVTESAGALLISILTLVVVVVYWLKKDIEKKSENDE